MQQKEIEYFSEILIERKAQLEDNILVAYEEIGAMSGDDLKDDGDHAAVSSGSLIDNSIATQQRQELDEIELAISKIKSSTYGTCEMCEDNIGFARLKAKPYARYCIDCREITEKQSS